MAQQAILVVGNFVEAEFIVNILYGYQGTLQSINTWSCATNTKNKYKAIRLGWEMMQWLGVCTVLTEDLDLLTSTKMEAHSHL